MFINIYDVEDVICEEKEFSKWKDQYYYCYPTFKLFDGKVINLKGNTLFIPDVPTVLFNNDRWLFDLHYQKIVTKIVTCFEKIYNVKCYRASGATIKKMRLYINGLSDNVYVTSGDIHHVLIDYKKVTLGINGFRFFKQRGREDIYFNPYGGSVSVKDEKPKNIRKFTFEKEKNEESNHYRHFVKTDINNFMTIDI